MAEISKEYHEELGWIYVPKIIAQILTEVSKIDNVSRKVMILEFHVQALEEERRRGFTLQIPHCMLLLEDAIEMIKQEIQRWEESEKISVVPEFMPLKSGLEGSSRAKESKDMTEKKEWMSSVQLRIAPVQYDNNFDKNQNNVLHQKYSCLGDRDESEVAPIDLNAILSEHQGGAYVPVEKSTMKNKGVAPDSSSAAESEVAPIDLNVTAESPQIQEPHPQPLPKKQRRCWSPQLHKQFVDALQQLGGVESATPKHIREVMNVDGLTNDEIKSHLQKYRLHIRKLPSLR